jgi:RNA polymerase sigma factor (sigma-70 family)
VTGPATSVPDRVEGLLRELAPQALAALVRRHGDFDHAEDAVQEALIDAAAQWRAAGVPANPRGWLVTVAGRRLIEIWRNEASRRRREDAVAADPVEPDVSGVDDSLELLLLCCHPALTRPSQLALTLRAVGGLTTAEIARALLVPEATIAQRISRAKAAIARAGARFELPADGELGARIGTVAAVVYLIFTEGHTASSGAAVGRAELTGEAIRLGRLLHARAGLDARLAAYRGELAGLLALMLLTDARAASRVGEGGTLIPLAEQDRSVWDRAMVEEGVALVTAALRDCPLGPYQLQAAIAAVHAEAPSTERTDWPQILALYDLLVAFAPGPMTSLNRIVAVAMVRGERAALDELATGCAATPALAAHHRSHAVRAHLLDRLGESAAAATEYRTAARLTLSLPEQRYLTARAWALSDPGSMRGRGRDRGE